LLGYGFFDPEHDFFDDPPAGGRVLYGRIAEQQCYDFADGSRVARAGKAISFPAAGEFIQATDNCFVPVALFAFQG